MKQTPNTALSERDLQFLKMGRAAMIPGFQRAIETLQQQLDEMRQELYALQAVGTAAVVIDEDHRLPAPKKSSKGRKKQLHNYWAGMTPEERSAEMRRRFEVRDGKRKPRDKRTKAAKALIAAAKLQAAAKLHPRDPQHPGHERWKKDLSRARKREWAKLTVRQQRERLAKMNAGKQAKTPVAKLEVA